MEAVCEWVVESVVVGVLRVITVTTPKCLVEALDAPVYAPAKKNKRSCEYLHFVCDAPGRR